MHIEFCHTVQEKQYQNRAQVPVILRHVLEQGERTIHLIMYPVYIEASDGFGNLDILEFLKIVP